MPSISDCTSNSVADGDIQRHPEMQSIIVIHVISSCRPSQSPDLSSTILLDHSSNLCRQIVGLATAAGLGVHTHSIFSA